MNSLFSKWLHICGDRYVWRTSRSTVKLSTELKENIYTTYHVSYNDIHRGGLQWKSAHIPTQNICLHPGAIVIHSLLLVPVTWYHRNGIFPKQLLCESGERGYHSNIEPEKLDE